MAINISKVCGTVGPPAGNRRLKKKRLALWPVISLKRDAGAQAIDQREWSRPVTHLNNPTAAWHTCARVVVAMVCVGGGRSGDGAGHARTDAPMHHALPPADHRGAHNMCAGRRRGLAGAGPGPPLQVGPRGRSAAPPRLLFSLLGHARPSLRPDLPLSGGSCHPLPPARLPMWGAPAGPRAERAAAQRVSACLPLILTQQTPLACSGLLQAAHRGAHPRASADARRKQPAAHR